jgi:CheY-like chemotaxis protein
MDVVTCESGENAIDMALREMPNIILLDLFLPKKGGLAILEVLKSQPATRNIPVVVLTAYPREEYREKSMRNGAKLFLSKSDIVPLDLVEKVKEILS